MKKYSKIIFAVLLLFFIFIGSYVNLKALLNSDVNRDGSINIVDIGIVIDNYSRNPIPNRNADVNADGRVDIIDIGIVIDNYGTSGNPLPTGNLVTTGTGIWISQQEILSRPTTGAAWTAVLADASGAWGSPSVSNQDSDHDQKVMAGALVCARTGQHCDKTRQGLLSAIGTESGARWLAIGRNMTGYTIAADVMRNSGNLTGNDLSRVNDWLSGFLTRTLAHNNSGAPVIMEPFGSGSNASAQEGAVYAAIAAYTKNTSKLSYVWNRFRLYSCDRTNNPEQRINVETGFGGGWSHTTNYNEACGVNPKGATKNGVRIDGAIINDMVRGASFVNPPVHTQYPWVGIEGYIPAALILQRAGFPAFQLNDEAVRRTVEYMCYLDQSTTTDWWNAGDSGRVAEGKHLIKVIYGYSPAACPINYPTGAGRVVGYTDWTHPN